MGGYIAFRGKMRPKRIKGKFNPEMVSKCKQFAEDSLDSSIDQYERRGQDPGKRYRMIIQLTNGKMAEEMAYATYRPYFPDLTPPDYQVYHKKDKSWTPDLISVASNIKIAVKSKDARDAKEWGASWIFEKKDRKIFGEKLDNQNLDPNQYVCVVVINQSDRSGEVKACVGLQWLHDNNLFEKPDRDYLETKLTVRLNTLTDRFKNNLWQLKYETP